MHQDVTDQVLADRRLRAADKLSAITTQAAGVAHDFNNLLGVIVGQTDVCLALTEPESRLASNLGKIKGAARKASQLVSSMLEFSNQNALNAVHMPISSFMERCRSLLNSTVPERIALSVRCDLVDEVRVEAESLDQVILNLASNATYAMGVAGGKLSIWVDKVAPRASAIDALPADGTRYLRIAVRDNGTGIPPEVIDSIFDPFFTTKPIGEGAGLGLAAAQGIVRAHGGGMDVESTLGAGTTFYIHLPIVTADMPSAAPDAVSMTAGVDSKSA